MDIKDINWSKIWKEGVLFFIGQAQKNDTWDRTADKWNEMSRRDMEYRDEVIRRMRLNKEWTLIDAGCGTGLLAIPLAKNVKKITALDSSSNMLRYCKKNAAIEKITNIDYVHKRFEEAVIGKDIKTHDVVIASRSMGHEHNLEKFLIALNNVAKKYAYLTWGADERTFDMEVHKAIGRKYGDTRTYIIIYNLLHQLGIRANIEMFECPRMEMEYSSPDEATEQIKQRFSNMNMNRELNIEEEIRLRDFFRNRLRKTDNGKYIYPAERSARHTLIWWKKYADLPV